MAGQRAVGVFNASGPVPPITMHQMLFKIGQGVHVEPKIVWAPTSFLSRPSRNQTGISNAFDPQPYGLFLDDLPIHIRPNLPAARVQT